MACGSCGGNQAKVAYQARDKTGKVLGTFTSAQDARDATRGAGGGSVRAVPKA